MKRTKMRAGAIAAALTLLASFGAVGTATAATAPADQTDVNGTSQEAANPALINDAAAVHLTIHKYLGGTTGAPNNGTELQGADVPTNDPVDGVEFTIYKVDGVDLTTNAGWEAAGALKAAGVTAADAAAGSISDGTTTYTLSGAQTATTANGGLAVVNPTGGVGLYLVVETDASGATVGGTAVEGTITPARPFLVTLPMTQPDELNSWMYDVHVYPKNQADEITKEVLDGNVGTANQDGYQVGENVTYRLESSINAVDANQDGDVNGLDIGYYLVKDTLSPYVTYQDATLSIVDDSTEPATVVETLVEGTDYVVIAPTAPDTTYQFSFTSAGLNKLALNSGNVVRTDIVTEVTTMPADGIVANIASFIPNNSWWQSNGTAQPDPGTPFTPEDPNDTPEVPSNDVESRYGDIVLQKTNQDGVLLDGAEFAVFRATWDETATAYTCTGVDYSGTPIATSAATVGGYTALNDLQLSNWYNDGVESGEITDSNLYHSYCLVETKAPADYQLLADPIEFDLTVAGDVTDLSLAYADAARDATVTDAMGGNLEVINMEDNLGNNLPLTGGQGVALVSALGIALIGGGIGYYTYSNRRKDA